MNWFCLFLAHSVLFNSSSQLASRRKVESCTKKIFSACRLNCLFRLQNLSYCTITHKYMRECRKTKQNKWKRNCKNTHDPNKNLTISKLSNCFIFTSQTNVHDVGHCREFSCQRSSHKWPIIIVLLLSFKMYSKLKVGCMKFLCGLFQVQQQRQQKNDHRKHTMNNIKCLFDFKVLNINAWDC